MSLLTAIVASTLLNCSSKQALAYLHTSRRRLSLMEPLPSV